MVQVELRRFPKFQVHILKTDLRLEEKRTARRKRKADPAVDIIKVEQNTIRTGARTVASSSAGISFDHAGAAVLRRGCL